MNEALIVLTELVALKEMKTQAEALLYYDTDTEGNRRNYQSVKPHDKPKYDALMAQYMARKDAAWQQAAAVVKASKK